MKTEAKIAIAAVVVIVVVAIIYFIMKPKSGTWTETKGGDISGAQFDIESRASGTLDEDKAYALKLGAKSFLRSGNSTYFKNVNTPVVTTPGESYTLYILK